MEGLVAKRSDSIYESGAWSGAWLKLPLKSKGLELLVVGYYEGKKLLFAGDSIPQSDPRC
jgi:ATP-dependent DNA ligase